MTFPEVTFLSQNFEYIPDVGVSGYMRLELVKDYTRVDSDASRDFLYHRFSWCESVTGEFEFLREVPLGVATVSGF